MRRFISPSGAIQTKAAIEIAASPERAAAIYRDVEKWGRIFPATIESARVIEAGDNWQQVEVRHRLEGQVPNTLIFLSETEIGLEESKKMFEASFLNRFLPAEGDGTRYEVTSYVRLKWPYRLLKPFLKGYVHRQSFKQMQRYVLVPLKKAAEQGF